MEGTKDDDGRVVQRASDTKIYHVSRVFGNFQGPIECPHSCSSVSFFTLFFNSLVCGHTISYTRGIYSSCFAVHYYVRENNEYNDTIQQI